MQKKVGIFTFYNLYNYGSIIQAYALQTYLEQHDLYSEFIKFSEKNYVIRNHHPKCKKLFSFIKNVPFIANYQNRKRFDVNRDKKRNLTFFCNNSLCYSKAIPQGELNNINYDALVLGSDQILNIFCINSAFTLNFETKIPAYYYAASVGVSNFDSSYFYLYDSVNKAKKISCREENNSRFLSALLNRKVAVCVDPVLLFDKDFFSELITNDIKESNYCFRFFLGNSLHNVLVSKKISKIKKTPIHSIPMCRDLYFFDKQTNNYTDSSMESFLSLIKNSSFVITDSYHVVLLSFIFEKDFYFLSKHHSTKNNENERILDFLRLAQLENRFIHEAKDIANLETIDYKKAKRLVSKRVIFSKNYLNQIIDEIKRK
jgi:hypothetical protein